MSFNIQLTQTQRVYSQILIKKYIYVYIDQLNNWNNNENLTSFNTQMR